MNRSGRFLLLLTESFRFLDGKQQLLLQLFKALVRWQIQTVKTAEETKDINGIFTFELTPELVRFQLKQGLLQSLLSVHRTNSRTGHKVHEPRVTPRKPSVLSHLLNAELLRPVTSCTVKGPQ